MHAERGRHKSVRKKKDSFYRYAYGKYGYRKACGKMCYPSSGAAKSDAKNLRGSGQDTKGKPLSYYHCATCDAWHVGHYYGGEVGTVVKNAMFARRANEGLHDAG